VGAIADLIKAGYGALALHLSPEQLRSLTDAVPPEAVAGARYAPAQLAHLDSEKSGSPT
jgi:hypothetical protein